MQLMTSATIPACHDNYCCDIYERTVDTWKQQKHNSKSVENTYDERDTIKAFVSDYEAKHGKLSTPAQVTYKFDYNCARQTIRLKSNIICFSRARRY